MPPLSTNPTGDSSIKGGLQITNLVVSDPQKQFPETPLEAKLLLDAGLHKKEVVDLRQVELDLTPTGRGTNQLVLTGKLDMSDTNATRAT